MKQIILLFMLAGPFCGKAQPAFMLQGKIGNLPQKTLYLLNFYGEKNSVVDSTRTDADGTFSFSLPSSLAPGMYRLNWGKDKFIDLVFNRENIRLQTQAEYPGDSLRILESVENLLYYPYLALDRTNQMKLELLQPVLDYYPQQDPFYFQAAAEYEAIQEEQETRLDSLQEGNPGSYAIRIFALYRTPYLPASLPPKLRLTYLKQHYFDRLNFNDSALLRSNAWANKAISYLALYSDNRFTQKQLEAEFIKAVTLMLNAASVNPEVFKFLLDYLVSGFDKYHFEDVITYVAENFQDPFACEDSERKSALQKKLDTFKKIAIGQPAPDFELPDAKGKQVNLSSIPAEFTLVIFWSSECGHCMEILPKVKALYDAQKQKRYEILAVSIDTSRSAWLQVIKDEKLPWINASELKGFDSKPADLYNIYATPTMFLLDKDKKILAKPISYRELEAALRDQGLL
ncbi:MAG: redoxin domain-containing protein [bacterium]